ncbi:MAG: 4Fe-4S binding protein [Prevotellaceae bacterium]|jgi:NAD-dependent dihydropyrimidine dehydrogenase PreA subunit|nr:4Fe-4S binding protein [Prevotellaceae bacterium]
MKTLYCALGALIVLWLAGSIYRHIRRRGKIIHVAEGRCTGCKKCLKRCRREVLEAVKDEKGVHVVVKNPDSCTACGDCVDACKFKALELAEKSKVS